MKLVLDGEFNVVPHEMQVAVTFFVLDLPSLTRVEESTLKNLASKMGAAKTDFDVTHHRHRLGRRKPEEIWRSEIQKSFQAQTPDLR